jgi:GNAT superfamily N-acetyltransferase
MLLREAKINDANAISLLISQLAKKYIMPDCTVEGAELLLSSMTKQAIENYINSGYQYIVAMNEDQIVGVVGMKEHSHLYHLFVDDKYQGLGLSTSLWKMAKDKALLKGNISEFTVNSTPNARKVYMKLGFVPLFPDRMVRIKNGVKDIPMVLKLHTLDYIV